MKPSRTAVNKAMIRREKGAWEQFAEIEMSTGGSFLSVMVSSYYDNKCIETQVAMVKIYEKQ